MLNQDLALIEAPEGALDQLIAQLRQHRVDLRLRPDDFPGWSRGARFDPLLYMLTRTSHARDLHSGIELRNNLLGNLAGLQMHHIFPKALLYKHSYSRPEANALANFTFLTQETNLLISDRAPAEHLPRFEEGNPGVLASHWIPTDPELWQPDRYRDFLACRRELLAKAVNDLLDSLLRGSMPEEVTTPPVLERPAVVVPGSVASEDERQALVAINEWVVQQGLPEGEFAYELTEPDSGEPLAVLDLAWPLGLQEGLSAPVALLLDEGRKRKRPPTRPASASSPIPTPSETTSGLTSSRSKPSPSEEV